MVGALCALVAMVLLRMIDLFTNVFYYFSFSFVHRSPAGHHLGWLAVFVPVIGGLIIGLMARYGSERIRGHGIPEAIEAILIGGSRMQPKVAMLKPLSSAISIGSGGPFGAEGPIIMTGGAFGSMIAQIFHLTAAERKTLLVAGAAAGMSATFATPMAAVLLAVELLLFEWKPRSLVPVALASVVAALLRPSSLLEPGPLFPVPPCRRQLVRWHNGLRPPVVGLLAGVLALMLTVSRLCRRGSLPSPADPLDVVAGHRRGWPSVSAAYFHPRALGVGYDIIEELLNGRSSPRKLLAAAIISRENTPPTLSKGSASPR